MNDSDDRNCVNLMRLHGRQAIPRSCPTCGIFARCAHGIPNPLVKHDPPPKPVPPRDDATLLAAWDAAPANSLVAVTAEEVTRLSALLSRREQSGFWDKALCGTGAEGAD